MARPKRKTASTSLTMTQEVRDLWERCAALEHRSLTNMFEAMVREYAKRQGVVTPPLPAITPPPVGQAVTEPKGKP